LLTLISPTLSKINKKLDGHIIIRGNWAKKGEHRAKAIAPDI